MTRYIVVRCKTAGCQAVIPIEETQDTSRTVTIPLKVTPWIKAIQCPTCGNEHEYTEQDLEPYAAHEKND